MQPMQVRPTLTDQELDSLWRKSNAKEEERPRIWKGRHALGDFIHVAVPLPDQKVGDLPIWRYELCVRPSGATEWELVKSIG